PSFKSSIMPILGLPLDLVPVILPSIISFNKLFPRTTCPIQFLFRFIIVCTKHLSSPTAASTSTFVFLSCQLTFSILLHTHISKAFSLSTTSFFIVHVSQPYNATDHTNVLTIRFFSSFFKPFVKSSFELLKATFVIAILALTSSTQVPFSLITAPRYLNVVTCSTRCPSTTRFTPLPSSRETTIAFVFFDIYFHVILLSRFSQSIHHFLQPLLCASYHSLIVRESHISDKFTSHSHSFLNSFHCLQHHCFRIYGKQQWRQRATLSHAPPDHCWLRHVIPYPYYSLLSHVQITYQSSILPVHLQLLQHLHHFDPVYPIKCLFKIHKAYVSIIAMLQTPFAQHSHYSYCIPCSTSSPKPKLTLPYKPICLCLNPLCYIYIYVYIYIIYMFPVRVPGDLRVGPQSPQLV